MIINDYSMKLDSSHDLVQYRKAEETLVTWRGGADARATAYQKPVEVQLSPAARRQLESEASVGVKSEPVSLNLSQDALKQLIPKQVQVNSVLDKTLYPSDQESIEMKIIAELFYRITGKRLKIKFFDPAESAAQVEKSSQAIQKALNQQSGIQVQANGQEQQLVGWGLDYNYREINYEEEKLSFSAKGVVKTADGREIKLDVSLRMSRQFLSEQSLSIKAGDALIDPLVINLDGSGADLSDSKFEFDIDSDGQSEQISNLKSGSGYLALDKNGDGTVNNGSELFGPETGSGFSELAQYDADKNNWIDETDSIYQNLRIWSRNEDGSQTLMALGEAGIGAIYLGNAPTQFALGDGEAKDGQLKESGVYLREDGSAGFVQELDHAVQS